MLLTEDISERKMAELKLIEALSEAQRFREALDNVPAYIYMKDPQSRYVYANRPTLELFGCSAEELSGSDDTRFFPPDTVKRLREVDLRVFGGKKTTEEIDVADGAAGRRVYWEIKTPIYADVAQKTIWGLLGISTDITERKGMEEERERLIADLQAALAKIKTLSGLLPICMHCKKIRDDKGYWHQLEMFIRDHSETEFTHGVCPDCLKEFYPIVYEKYARKDGEH
ncbi:MAG: PAS domain-containing protein [Desulfobulbaceae bacterium]